MEKVIGRFVARKLSFFEVGFEDQVRVKCRRNNGDDRVTEFQRLKKREERERELRTLH